MKLITDSIQLGQLAVGTKFSTTPEGPPTHAVVALPEWLDNYTESNTVSTLKLETSTFEALGTFLKVFTGEIRMPFKQVKPGQCFVFPSSGNQYIKTVEGERPNSVIEKTNAVFLPKGSHALLQEDSEVIVLGPGRWE